MAETKTRGTQLLRTDDNTPGRVKFYRRDVEDVTKAFIAEVDVMLIPQTVEIPGEGEEPPTQAVVTPASLGMLPTHPLVAAAVHGITQNLLDSSNKLDGDARVAHIKAQAGIVQAGGWASAPVDDAKVKANAEAALRKLYAQMGLAPEAINAAVEAAMKAKDTKAGAK